MFYQLHVKILNLVYINYFYTTCFIIVEGLQPKSIRGIA